jgi:hypothetical protein
MESMTPLLALDATSLEQAQQAFYHSGAGVFAFLGGTALIVSLLGILYMTLVVAPNVTQRSSTALREHNVRSFLLGLPVLAGFLLLGLLLHRAPALVCLNGVLLGVLLIQGYAAAAEDIGRRLYWACGKEGTRASHLASGWLIFAFGSLFPVLGWFVIFPYVSISALGSVVVGACSRKAPAAPEAKEVEFDKS